MAFIVVIPARLHSTRLPRKVLREIAGEPMLAHVCRAAAASAAGQVIVAGDHPEIAAAARDAGAQPHMTRADHVCGTDRIAEVAAAYAWPDDTIVVNIQADEPMMPPALIDQVAAALEADPDAGIATACMPIDSMREFNDPHTVKVVASSAGRAVYFSRAPIPYHRDSGNSRPADSAYRHLGIYAYRAAALRRFAAAPPSAAERCEALEQLRAYDLDLPIALVTAVAAPGPGVDTQADLQHVARLMG